MAKTKDLNEMNEASDVNNVADATALSEAELVAKNEAYMKELVPVRLFVDNDKYKNDVVVAVNGVTYIIKRGVDVEVPRFVKEVIDNSIAQDGATARMLQGLSNDFETKISEIE